jgi:ubiquinone biosynthesis protein
MPLLSWPRVVLRGITISLLVLFYAVRLGLQLLYDAGGPRPLTGTRADQRRERFAVALVALLRRLGATFIKVGQIMSTRPDVIPPWLTRALEELQDDVGPFPYREVERTIREELGRGPEDVFARFAETPVASASVAQVHVAELLPHEPLPPSHPALPPQTRDVAVKVRRPGIEQLIDFDLAVVRFAGRIVGKLPGMSYAATGDAANAFAEGIRLQLDFLREARNNVRFTANFAGRRDVRFPRLVPQLCSERVLTMELAGGIKLKQALQHWSQGRTPPGLENVDRKELSRVGVRAMMKMVFVDGFVHADLHPGNIFVLADGSWMVVDLGLVAELDGAYKSSFTRFFAAWAMGDGETMAGTVLELSGARVADRPAFVRDMQRFLGQYYGKPLHEIQMAMVVVDMLRLLRRHQVRATAAFTLVNMAIAVTEGIGRQLDPELDLLSLALPFFAEAGILPGGPVAA